MQKKANESTDVTSFVSNLGLQSSPLYQYGKAIQKAHALWTNIVDDVCVFIFVLGFIIGLCALLS